MTQYRYQLERYRGLSTRHVCPQCGRKNVFTRYIDTYNNNIYINDSVGKCNRLDKCGYHYTPRQYFDDNPHLHNTDTYLHPWTPVTNIGKMTKCPVSTPSLQRKISWDSTSLSALISCQKGCRCGLDMKKPPMGST